MRGVALLVLLGAATSVLDLPFAWYRTFGIEQRFGFNKMTPRMFFVDALKNALLAAALGIPLLACILWVMERAGELWWLYAWLIWVAFNLVILTVYPIWIAPLFNKFVPLDDAQLKQRIERLLEQCGFKAQGLMVMDGSRRSSHGNAYFTGFGKSKRIVFFDTLLSRLVPSEIEAVLAHELGHFKLHHVVKRIAWIFAASLAFLWLLAQLMNQGWFYTRAQRANERASRLRWRWSCFSSSCRSSSSCCIRSRAFIRASTNSKPTTMPRSTRRSPT